MPTTTPQSSTQTLIEAMQILAKVIETDDGVINSAMLEASQRLEQQRDLLRECLPHIHASHGAAHMLVGFNIRPRPAIDGLLKRLVLADEVAA